MSPERILRSTDDREAPDGNSYSPGFSRRAEPVAWAMAMKSGAEATTLPV